MCVWGGGRAAGKADRTGYVVNLKGPLLGMDLKPRVHCALNDLGWVLSVSFSEKMGLADIGSSERECSLVIQVRLRVLLYLSKPQCPRLDHGDGDKTSLKGQGKDKMK